MDKKMMTQNNLFTFIRKYGAEMKRLGNPPPFYRQDFDLAGKTFVPFDELKSRTKISATQALVPYMFIEDSKQACFLSNPRAHSDILDRAYAVCSTDYSVFLDVPSELNKAVILINRFIASKFQEYGRYVILTLTWSDSSTFDAAFGNIQDGCIVAISTLGVKNWQVFADGFMEMLSRFKPEKICWYGTIPSWVWGVYNKQNIIIMQSRFECIEYKRQMEQRLLVNLYKEEKKVRYGLHKIRGVCKNIARQGT